MRIETWFLFGFFFSFLFSNRFATFSRRRACAAGAPARIKIESRSAALNCFVFRPFVEEFLAFLQPPGLSAELNWRVLSILIRSAHYWKICRVQSQRSFLGKIQTSSSCARRASLFPLLLFFFLIRYVAFALVAQREQGSDADERFSKR